MKSVLAELELDGFSLRPALAPNSSTAEVAHALGRVINPEALLPNGGISTIQSLRPKSASDSGPNRYSGHYGFGAFPLHTDLAHWAVPPRYLLLRCVVGTNDVFTCVLSWKPIIEVMGAAKLRKAVFTPRRHRIGYSGLVRAMAYHGPNEILRWDPIFLRPLTQTAKVLASAMLGTAWNKLASRVLLCQPGDTLLIDNWRMLHGRGAVPMQSATRIVERVYLAEVFR